MAAMARSVPGCQSQKGAMSLKILHWNGRERISSIDYGAESTKYHAIENPPRQVCVILQGQRWTEAFLSRILRHAIMETPGCTNDGTSAGRSTAQHHFHTKRRILPAVFSRWGIDQEGDCFIMLGSTRKRRSLLEGSTPLRLLSLKGGEERSPRQGRKEGCCSKMEARFSPKQALRIKSWL